VRVLFDLSQNDEIDLFKNTKFYSSSFHPEILFIGFQQKGKTKRPTFNKI